MARGIKRVEDRNQVRSNRISIRLNQYEFDQVIEYLSTHNDKRTISTFVRDLVIEHTKQK